MSVPDDDELTIEPTPVRCPAPDSLLAADEATGLGPLLSRLADPAPVTEPLTFPRGTLQPDGRLDLCKQDLSPLDAGLVIGAAMASSHTNHLLLGTNGLGAPGVAALAEALEPGHQVRTLYLGCNHIDTDGLAPLTERLARDETVRAVWLKRNPIGDAGVRALADALRGNATVRTLDLTNTGLTVVGLRYLVDALNARAVRLERLYLGGNNLGPEAGDPLGRLLREGGIGELYLAAGRIGDEGVRALTQAIAEVAATGVGSARIGLGLGGNGISPAGVRSLAPHLPLLRSLDLARPPSSQVLRALPNEVGDEGAAALAEALPGSGLSRLDLRHTGVTGRGARLLLAAAQNSPGLELLGLGSGMPRRVKRAVALTLSPPTPPAEDISAIVSVYR